MSDIERVTGEIVNYIMRLFILCRLLFDKCSISAVNKSSRIRREHMVGMEEPKTSYKILVGNS
jgi:hypothetical protein